MSLLNLKILADFGVSSQLGQDLEADEVMLGTPLW
jgi:hypothetical protein